MSHAPHHADEKSRELISFKLGAQEFCVDIMSVREIRGWTQPTPLPHAPSYVLGMINLRGVVLPIIDVGERLGVPVDEHATRRVIIVVWIGARLVGLLIDAVCDILTVSDDDVKAPPEIADETLQGFISAVLTIENRMICQLALDRFLSEMETKAA